jgi:hypothetical protein
MLRILIIVRYISDYLHNFLFYFFYWLCLLKYCKRVHFFILQLLVDQTNISHSPEFPLCFNQFVSWSFDWMIFCVFQQQPHLKLHQKLQ